MSKKGHNVIKLWNDIGDIIIKTLISAQPSLETYYKNAFGTATDGFTCFEILGFDIVIDKDCRPWLLEVNHAPSLRTDSPFDMKVKSLLIDETLNLIQMDPDEKIRFLRAKQIELKRRSLRHAGSESLPTLPPVSKECHLSMKAEHEDKMMTHFKRIFPSPDPTTRDLHERFLKFAQAIPSSLFSETKASSTRKVLQQRENEQRDMFRRLASSAPEKYKVDDYPSPVPIPPPSKQEQSRSPTASRPPNYKRSPRKPVVMKTKPAQESDSETQPAVDASRQAPRPRTHQKKPFPVVETRVLPNTVFAYGDLGSVSHAQSSIATSSFKEAWYYGESPIGTRKTTIEYLTKTYLGAGVRQSYLLWWSMIFETTSFLKANILRSFSATDFPNLIISHSRMQ
eukprot:TRINITY_DN6400_c0_g1_i9.p1 TRINITY_DN6400_c0_g1~~TRINITY_DN6400_c0_g1_i9.p1  ORF type:complete len:397 (+),score=69.28 TRINITY_DN6400_c0_g1_i9:388-1578(+)